MEFEEFVKKLKIKMLELETGQVELAKYLGIHQSEVSDLLNGKHLPRRKRMSQLLNFLTTKPEAWRIYKSKMRTACKG